MAGRIKDEDVALVRERVRLEDVVADRVALKSAGAGQLVGLCPFHDEKSPSFGVTPARQLYYCFGCGEGGDVFTFVQKLDQLTFSEAVEMLADKVGVRLRYDEDGTGTAGRRSDHDRQQRTRLMAAHKAAAEFYADQLSGPGDAVTGRRFLSERGFDQEAAATFGVGFAPRGGETLVRHLRTKKFSDDDLVTGGLAARGRNGLYDRFRGRLLWPIRDAGGEVIGFGARRLFDDDRVEAKYLNTPDSPIYHKSKVLYGVDLARRDIARRSQAVVVEGYTDVMACHLSGVPTAVATCGTSFGDEHARVLRNLLLDHDEFRGEVIFTFDGDAAGQKAAVRAYNGDAAFVSQTYVAVEPDGLDPCDLRLAQGDAAVRELIARRVPLYRFVLGTVLARYDLDRADGRVDALRAAAPLVVSVRDRAKVDGYARELAGRLGMDVDEVREEIRRAASRPRADPNARNGRGHPSGPSRDGRRPDGRGEGGRSGEGRRSAEGRDSGGGSDGPVDGAGGDPQDRQRPRKEVPDPRDPRFAVEWEALKLLTQHPALAGTGFEELDENDFTHPWLADIWRAMVAAGGPGRARSSESWVLAVREACVRPESAALLAALAVEALRLDKAPDTALMTASLARVQELTCLRRIRDLKSKLQRTSPVDNAEAYNRMFGELIALEQHRVRLRDLAVGGAV